MFHRFYVVVESHHTLVLSAIQETSVRIDAIQLSATLLSVLFPELALDHDALHCLLLVKGLLVQR